MHITAINLMNCFAKQLIDDLHHVNDVCGFKYLQRKWHKSYISKFALKFAVMCSMCLSADNHLISAVFALRVSFVEAFYQIENSCDNSKSTIHLLKIPAS